MCVRLALRLADCGAQPQSWYVSFCAGGDHRKQTLPQQVLVPAKIFLGICCLQSLLDPALMLSEASHWVCWFWAFWEGLWCRSMLDTVSAWSIGNLFGVISLGVHGKGQAAHEGQLFPVLGQKSQGTPKSTSPCLCLWPAC